MEKVKKREELIERIRKIEDELVIEEIYRLLYIDFDDSIYHLNEAQKQEIKQAREEINRGEGIKSNDLNSEIDKWLKK